MKRIRHKFLLITVRHGSRSAAAVAASREPERRAIRKVLVANRGEIACRVMRTARRMGVQTVAVFSDADRDSLHVKMADESVNIGPAPSSESYLCGDKILAAAQRLGADAVHPGYGFLSENARFADRCAESGVLFIGPPSAGIRDMGIKSTSKAIMSAAGVPVIEGYHGVDQSDETLRAEAARIGYPVMLKAVMGGGGKGMRIAMDAAEFTAQLQSARSEALKAFGNSDMLVEKFVQRPRHVEVQVFCDHHGNAVYLFERDCSVQRRHQKIIEEAPAPGVPWALRRELGEVAVRAAKAVGYVGAGTVEFIMDTHLNFFFMEMNTRLQVEHPISEMITGVDLVEWQIRVAGGEPLPLTQHQLTLSGHSFEARIYAEDPHNDFMPGAGHLSTLVQPQPIPDTVRVETGVNQGDNVSVHYDPLIAKLVVWGENRQTALTRLLGCLNQYQVVGVKTNVCFLKSLASHPAFVSGHVHTDFIPDHHQSLFPPAPAVTHHSLCRACLAHVLSTQAAAAATSNDPRSAWNILTNFHVNLTPSRMVLFRVADQEDPVLVAVQFLEDGSMRMTVDESSYRVWGRMDGDGQFTCQIDDHRSSFSASIVDGQIHLFSQGVHEELWLEARQKVPGGAAAAEEEASAGSDAVAPMTGVIDKVSVSEGDRVVKNAPLLTMTAMKMEYTVKASAAGTVRRLLFKPGDTVDRHAKLIEIQADE